MVAPVAIGAGTLPTKALPGNAAVIGVAGTVIQRQVFTTYGLT